MKEIISALADVQLQMEKIESRLTSITMADIAGLDEAGLMLERYHHTITKLENTILQRRLELLEKKIVLTDTLAKTEATITDPPVV